MENFSTKTVLFQGATPQEVEQMLSCLGAQRRVFPKGAYVYHAGEPVRALGVVLSGSVSIENDDFWGNKSILDRVEAGGVFAETYACIPGEPLMVSVVAVRAVPDPVFGGRTGTAYLSGCLPVSYAPDRESAAHFRPKEPESVPADLSHICQDHPGAAAVFFVLSGSTKSGGVVHHSV